MRKLYTLFYLCIGAALLYGCNSIDLPKSSSKGYSSYWIYKHSPDHMPDFSDREDRANELIKATLKQKFNEHGLKESESIEDAELVVTFLIIVQDGATSAAIRDYYMNSGDEILHKAHKRMVKKTNKPKKADEYYTDDYVAGSLIVDIIDTKNNKLIYRDYMTRKIFDSMSEEERKQTVVEGIDEVTATFFRR